MIADLHLFAAMIARVALLTGLGPGIAIAILIERGRALRSLPKSFRRRAVSSVGLMPDTSTCRATSPSRKVRHA